MKKLQMSLTRPQMRCMTASFCLIAFRAAELRTMTECSVNIKSRWWLSAALGPHRWNPHLTCCLSEHRTGQLAAAALLRRSLITTGLVERYLIEPSPASEISQCGGGVLHEEPNTAGQALPDLNIYGDVDAAGR
jgi:hypothetical protein